MSDFIDILEKHKRKTARRSQAQIDIEGRIEKADYVQTALMSQLDAEHDKQASEALEEKYEKVLKYERRQEELLGQQREKDLIGATSALSGGMEKITSDSSKRINTYQDAPSVRSAAYSRIGTSSYNLERSISGKESTIRTLTNKMHGLVDETKGVTDEGLYGRYASAIEHQEKGIARSSKALQFQKQAKMDDIGVMKTAQTISSSAESILKKDEINQRMAKGEFGNAVQESNNLAKKLNKLTDSIAALNKATDEERDGKKKLAEQAGKDVQEQMNILSSVERGGGGGGKLNSLATILDGLSKTLGNFGSAYGQVQIDNPLKIMQNQTRFMGMHNEQYSTVQKMAQGDQMSLMKVMGMYGGNKEFSEDFMGRGTSYMGTKIGSAGLGLAADAAKIAAVGTVTGGWGAAAMAAGSAGDISGGVSNLVSLSSDYRNNITAGGISADAYDRRKDMFEAINRIPATQIQSFEDQYRRSYSAGTGLGAGSKIGAELSYFGEGSTLNKLASLNVSPEKAAMLTQIGGQTVGGKDLTMGMVTSAAKAERAGTVSTEQYMQLMGSMADIGGGNKELYNSLKMAVTTGMDDSKSISRMVSATVSLADKTSASGVITSEGVSEAVMQASNFKDTMMTTSQRTRVGAGSAAGIDKLLSRGGTDIYSLQELSSITEAVRGTDVSQAGRISLEKMGLSEMSSVKDLLGDEDSDRYKKAVESVGRMGLSGLVGNKKAIQGVLAAKGGTAAQRIMGFGTEFSDDARSYITGVFSGKTKTNSFEDFTDKLDKIDPKSLSEFKARAYTQGITTESLYNVVAGDGLKKTEAMPTYTRMLKNAKQAVESERAVAESEKGMNKMLESVGVGYTKWKKQRGAEVEEIISNNGGHGPEVKDSAMWFDSATEKEKKQEYMNLYQKEVTKYTREKSMQSVRADHKDRVESAGKLETPAALIDASETFNDGAKIFGATVNGDFKNAIADFKTAVDGMNKLSSRPNTTKYTDDMKENLKNDVANNKKHLGKWH